MKKSPKLRVLFNDAHANHPKSPTIPQGGPSRFAQIFTKYFKDSTRKTELISVLFSHNNKNGGISTKETIGDHLFLELVYPRNLLIQSFTKKYTKKSYKRFLTPWLSKLGALFDIAQPNVVFLNGYNLSNWLLLETAYKRNIPVCIQHAGIWKKEMQNSKNTFSPSIRRIFVGLEKEILQKAKHQIFLNEFSRDEFFKLHNVQKNRRNLKKTSIISLPLDVSDAKEMHLPHRSVSKVGMVARWDSIKNHSAMARLASHVHLKKLPIHISVVTEWKKNTVSNFKSKYETLVEVVDTMSPMKLKKYYSKQDIILIPSQFDVSPTVLMEALIEGKPVIISNSVGWVSDYKRFGLSELVIPPHASGESIIKTISILIENSEKYLSKLSKLQRKIIKEHNPSIIFSQYHKIFKLISKKQ